MIKTAKRSRLEIIYDASTEVAPAIVTAVSTTIVSFLPVFTLQAAEGRLFSPLAFTKTFALVASLIIAIAFMPVLAWQFSGRIKKKRLSRWQREIWVKMALNGLLIAAGVMILIWILWWGGLLFILLGLSGLLQNIFPERVKPYKNYINPSIILLVVLILLGSQWQPVGVERSLFINILFLFLVIAVVLGVFRVFLHYYPQLLVWCITHRAIFLSVPVFLLVLGLPSGWGSALFSVSWQGVLTGSG
jgi:copper/silver efflux system protein